MENVTEPHVLVTMSSCEELESLTRYHWVNFIFISTVAVVGLLSQIIVIVVIRSIKTKTSTDIFLLVLSVLDILVILSLSVTENNSIYSHILSPGRQIYNAGYLAVVAHPFEHMAHFASTWCIVLMSVDRYISICHRNKAATWCTPRNAKLQLILLIVVDVIYSIPRFIEYYSIFPVLAEEINPCSAEIHDFPAGTLGSNILYIWGYTFIAYLLLMYITPLGILTFTNYHLIRIIKTRISFHKSRKLQHSKESLPSTAPIVETQPDVSEMSSKPVAETVDEIKHSSVQPLSELAENLPDVVTEPQKREQDEDKYQTNSLKPVDNNNVCDKTSSLKQLAPPTTTKVMTSSNNIRKQYDHVIRMLITVTVIFSICQIPDMVVQLISRLYDGLEIEDELEIIAYDFVIINSSINLFIYTATSRRFKRQLDKTFKCCRGNQVGAVNGQTTAEQS